MPLSRVDAVATALWRFRAGNQHVQLDELAESTANSFRREATKFLALHDAVTEFDSSDKSLAGLIQSGLDEMNKDVYKKQRDEAIAEKNRLQAHLNEAVRQRNSVVKELRRLHLALEHQFFVNDD
jgi:hypothetical protein